MKHGAWSGLLARRQKNEWMEYAARKRRFRVKNLVHVDKNLSFCSIWKTHTCVIWGIILFCVNLHLIPWKNTSSFMQHQTFCYEQAYVFVWNSWFLDVRNHMCSIEHHTCFFWNSMFFFAFSVVFSEKKTTRFHVEFHIFSVQFHTFFCEMQYMFSIKFHMFSVKVRTLS